VSARLIRLALGIGILWTVAGLGIGFAQPCVQNDQTLCLNDDRFAVTARFRTANTGETDATAVELTGDSGYFWFFNPANIEVVIKVLSGCSLNQHYWVFATGLTNVEVTLFVTDTTTDTLKTYTNQLGVAFAPIQDTSAFAACP
jgi:hypothetical protein